MGMPHHFYSPDSTFPFPTASTASPAPCQVPTPVPRAHSRPSTPQFYSQREAPEREGAESHLFQSRCSSPLNLLQLEESPINRFEVVSGQQTTSPMLGQGGVAGGQVSSSQRGSAVDSKKNENVRKLTVGLICLLIILKDVKEILCFSILYQYQ